MNIQTITQKAKYDVRMLSSSSFLYFQIFIQMQGLVAALGGALSLYLGIAIAMVFEFLELFVEISLVLIKHKK